jgi:hypothetical protein
MVILPNKSPKKMQTNVENIKNGIPWTKINPERIFIFSLYIKNKNQFEIIKKYSYM